MWQFRSVRWHLQPHKQMKHLHWSLWWHHGRKKEHYSDLKFLTLTFVKFQNICYSLRKVIPALLMLEISTDHMWIWLGLPFLDCVRQVYYLCGLWHSIVFNSASGAKATWEIVSPLTLQVYTAALHHLLTMIGTVGKSGMVFRCWTCAIDGTIHFSDCI